MELSCTVLRSCHSHYKEITSLLQSQPLYPILCHLYTVHSLTPYPLISILMALSNLCLPSGIIPSDSLAIRSYVFLVSAMCVICQKVFLQKYKEEQSYKMKTDDFVVRADRCCVSPCGNCLLLERKGGQTKQNTIRSTGKMKLCSLRTSTYYLSALASN